MRKGSSTNLIHGGEGASIDAHPLTTPIYETTTYVFDSADAVRRYNAGGSGTFLYTRYENPTLSSVETKLALADGAPRALLFASGMAAATTAMLALLSSGDEVVCSAAVYGGVYHFAHDVLPRYGIVPRFVTPAQLASPASVISTRTKLLWFESPSNPHLRCADLERIAEACRHRGVVSAIDNTFASPINQRPFEMGIDVVMQSATKYLNGHSDVTAGVVSGREDVLQTIELLRRKLGGTLDPHAAYLLGRSVKTLVARMAVHNANGLAVAQAIEGHPRLRAVLYPGLASHPDHALAARQMAGFGGMVCIDVEGGEEAACRVFDRFGLIKRAVSLGGVESVASLPILTSHWGHSDAQLAEAGISKGMIRISIGLEEAADLIEDLRQALAF